MTRELTRQAYAVFAIADLSDNDCEALGKSGIVTVEELVQARASIGLAIKSAESEAIAEKDRKISDLEALCETLQGQLQAMADAKPTPAGPPAIDLVGIFDQCGLTAAVDIALDYLNFEKTPTNRRTLIDEVLKGEERFRWLFEGPTLTGKEFNALAEAIGRGDQ